MDDLCPCGCGEPRTYPIGPTREEAELMRDLLKRYRKRWRTIDRYSVAERLSAKVEKALEP